ncbi:MAG: hypothetical protein HQK87_01000 [Nitrospinae bacterium]|nr:hypothetical protein [Nitrospinota bacterium]
MSRLYKQEEGDRVARPFDMPTFDKPLAPRVTREERFIPDKGLEKGGEFILGGFDFDLSGGLRREEILNKSSDEAARMIAAARAEAAAIAETARKEGFAAGKKEGYAAGQNTARPLIDSMTALVRELTAARGEFYRNAEGEMIDLVVAVSKTVFGVLVEAEPSLVRNVIIEAVDKLQAKEELNIKVAPDDLAEAEKVRPQLSEMVENIDRVTFAADPNLVRGGCLVETNIGAIDARIETQLETVREAFLSALMDERGRKGGANNAG